MVAPTQPRPAVGSPEYETLIDEQLEARLNEVHDLGTLERGAISHKEYAAQHREMHNADRRACGLPPRT